MLLSSLQFCPSAGFELGVLVERQIITERSLSPAVHEVSGTAENRITEMLASIERTLNELAKGLGLVGLKRCFSCSKFFKNAGGDALFDGGELVCFGCIPAWWRKRSEQLSLEDRRNTESKLVFWLRSHHQAEIVKQSANLGEDQQRAPRMVATCLQCRGEGTLFGDRRCRYCDGPGKVWVIVPGWAVVGSAESLMSGWS